MDDEEHAQKNKGEEKKRKEKNVMINLQRKNEKGKDEKRNKKLFYLILYLC